MGRVWGSKGGGGGGGARKKIWIWWGEGGIEQYCKPLSSIVIP